MSALAWVPRSCTLPAEERPLRVAEWDALFSEPQASLSRPEPLRLRLGPAGGPGVEGRLRDLVERESGCCSFFTFTIGPGPGPGPGEHPIVVDITVEPAREAVLDALAARAAAVREQR
ncbi:hypothetical protein AB0N31_18775 [Streptomyces sp. NPDC051051]|uniref:hypothetical protein n=1 Tax=Streptomyces sp. NPDC051051 TaxID=3155666 RepID=UPI003448E0F4